MLFNKIKRWSLLNKLNLLSEDKRSKTIFRNVSISLCLKPITLLLYLLLIKISLRILDPALYGIWITTFSLLSAISFLDVGLGSGLRNKLSEALSLNKIETAQAYVSTAYFTMLCLIMSIIIIAVPFLYFIDIASFFKVSKLLSFDIKLSFFICLVGVCFLLLLKLLNIIFFAKQNTFFPDVIWIISQVLVAGLLFIFQNQIRHSLVLFALIFSLTPIVVYVIASFIFFSNKFKNLSPKLALFKRSYVKDIMVIGVKFFIIQVSGIVLYSIDNLLITYLYDNESVAKYSVSFRYFNILVMAFSTILLPYWSMTTNAYTLGDIQWIKAAIKKLTLLWIVFAVIGIGMLLLSGPVYAILSEGKVQIHFVLSIVLLIYSLIMNWAGIFNTIMYGIGIIDVQMRLSIFGIIINVPLAIVLAKYFNLGLISIPLSYIIYAFIVSVFVKLQLKKILNREKEIVTVYA